MKPESVPPEETDASLLDRQEADEEDPAAWGRATFACWAEGWSDPREDIYSAEG
jgi:hypothetical protein